MPKFSPRPVTYKGSQAASSDAVVNKATPLTDEEFRQAVATQQSAYESKPRYGTDVRPPSQSPTTQAAPVAQYAPNTKHTGKRTTVKRTGGGKTWEDRSLLEWDPSHFRLFVGNLSPEVTDEMLTKAFGAYPSLAKVRVVKDSRKDLGKGFGFVAFKDPDDYFKAFKEINGKYIGLHPVQLKRANTDVKPTSIKAKPYRR